MFERVEEIARSEKERPRLLIITPDFPPARGGIQTMSLRLATLIRGFQTKVVAPDSASGSEFDSGCEIAVRRVRFGRRGRRASNAMLNAAALHEAARFRPAATLSLHVVASPASALINAALGAPTVQYFHANEIADKRRLSVFAASRADAVIAVSSYTEGLLRAAGASPARLRLIPPGVDLPPPAPSPNEQQPTVLTIARLEHPYKGHDVLIEALSRVRASVPKLRWIVIGEGPLRGNLEALASARGLADSTTFLGAVSDEQRDEWLRQCALFAMPSRLPGPRQAGEGFGMVYLEAAAHGKPVVAGNVAGALDAVADGESGLLVDPTDAVAVAGAITKLLRDRALAHRMGRAGAERARAFAWSAIAERVEALLLEQLAASPRLRTRRSPRAGDQRTTA
jgi:phosphatidyl-myo-inositol dimannoside synthase